MAASRKKNDQIYKTTSKQDPQRGERGTTGANSEAIHLLE